MVYYICKTSFTLYVYLYVTINIYTTFYNIYKLFNAMFIAFFAKMRFKPAYFFSRVFILCRHFRRLKTSCTCLHFSDNLIKLFEKNKIKKTLKKVLTSANIYSIINISNEKEVIT